MKRLIAIALVLSALMAVHAKPENDLATDTADSECYDCHKGGDPRGAGPALTHIFRIFLDDAPALEPGASTELNFNIINWWTSEMMGFNGYIDLDQAPSFSFEAAREPVSGSKESTLPEYEPAAYFQGTPRTIRMEADIESGGTDLLFTLTPEEDTDVMFRLWEPGRNPETQSPSYEIDEGVEGVAETIAIRGTSTFSIPGGRYIIEAVETPNEFDVSQDMFDEADVALDWTLGFEVAKGDPRRSGATTFILDGQDKTLPQETQLSWNVNVISDITTEQRITVHMESVGFYDHAPASRAIDEWLFFVEVEYLISPDGAGNYLVQRLSPKGTPITEFVVGDDSVEVSGPEEGPDLTVEEEAGLDIAAEIVGYVAAFLLILSLLTGGAFGNWSRKLQQVLLYRRAKKRVAFHNVISYGLILAATIHLILFLVEKKYPWSVGMFLGGVSILGMFLSGITGAWQRGMVKTLGHEGWRWLHYLSFVLAFGGAAGHILLDGIHFADFQSSVAWEDPLVPILEEWIPPAGSE